MSDRPAPPSSPPTSRPTTGSQQTTPRTPPPSGPPPSSPPRQRPVIPPPADAPGQVNGQPSKPPKTPKAPKAPRGRDKSEAEPTPAKSDTAVRGGLAERIQAKLASVTSPTDREGAGSPGDTDDERDAPSTKTSARPVLEKEPKPAKSPKPVKEPRASRKSKRPSRGPRKARLRLTRIDPWSVMKTAFLLSIAFGIVTVVTVAMVMQVLDAAGVWTSINDSVREVIEGPELGDFDIRDYVGTERVVGFAMLVAAVDVVLLTAIATLGAFLYNMSAALLGGIEVTLAEDN